MFWHVLWVTIVALVLFSAAWWGFRTYRSIGGVVVSAAAFLWALFRPDAGGWFLYRPIGWSWTSLILVLLIFSVPLAFTFWRLAKLIGGIALFVAILAPFRDLFTSEMWLLRTADGDWLWWVILLALVIGLIFILVRALATAFGVVLVVLAVLTALGFAGWRAAINEPDGPSAEPVVDVCVNISGDQAELPGGYELDGEGNCIRKSDEVKDVCQNLEGIQKRVPPHRVLNRAGNCVKQSKSPTAEQIAKAVVAEMREQGFRPGEWTSRVDWRKHIVQRSSAFTDQTLKTQQDVFDFLLGSSQSSMMARQQALQALHGRPITDCVYVPVQFNIPVQYRGNTYLQGAKIITPDGLRQARPGDVIWLCVLDGEKVNWGASLRADCGNVKFDEVIPVRPNTPPAPPVTCVRRCQPSQPPPNGGGCVEIPGNGVYDCGAKDPSEEPAQQGNVPTQVQGQNPGTGGQPASQPSANPQDNYTPPPPPGGGGGSGSGSGGGQNPPPPEPSTPPPDDPEPSPTSDPCEANPDFC